MPLHCRKFNVTKILWDNLRVPRGRHIMTNLYRESINHNKYFLPVQSLSSNASNSNLKIPVYKRNVFK